MQAMHTVIKTIVIAIPQRSFGVQVPLYLACRRHLLNVSIRYLTLKPTPNNIGKNEPQVQPLRSTDMEEGTTRHLL